jgi:hypothetical protein
VSILKQHNAKIAEQFADEWMQQIFEISGDFILTRDLNRDQSRTQFIKRIIASIDGII